MHCQSNNMSEIRTTRWSEGWGHGHQYHDYHLHYSGYWCSQWDTWEWTSQEKSMGHKRCSRPLWWDLKQGYEAEGKKEYREANKRIQKAVKRAKKDWIDTQCEEIKTWLNKTNSKRAYKLVKDLTSEKQGRSSTIQDRCGKYLTEEQRFSGNGQNTAQNHRRLKFRP